MMLKRKHMEVDDAICVTRERDRSKYKYWGVETDEPPHDSFADLGFVIAPLLPPSYIELPPPRNYRLDLAQKDDVSCHLLFNTEEWGYNVIANINSWIDLDSDDLNLRYQSESTLNHELSLASRLSLQACVLPTPKSAASLVNYAKHINDFLRCTTNMQMWLRIPLMETEKHPSHPHTAHMVDSWHIWDAFRLLCGHHPRLSVLLEIPEELPSLSSIHRWLGEPLEAVILQTKSFQTNTLLGSPSLSKNHKDLLRILFDRFIKVVVSGNCPRVPSTVADQNGCGTQRHPYWLYLDYIGSLYPRTVPSLNQEHIEIRTRDILLLSPKPSTVSLKEIHAANLTKYEKYQEAISQALMDKVSDDGAPIVLVAFGIQCKQLVKVSLKAAEATGCKIKIYALQAAPYGDLHLYGFVKREGRGCVTIGFIKREVGGRITIVSGNNVEEKKEVNEKADILVSDFLSSFGDDKMSLERVDVVAQMLLKEDGIAIPSLYTSYIQPLTASKVYNEIKSRKDEMIPPLDSVYFVNLHDVTPLSSAEPVFKFPSANGDYEQFNRLKFQLPSGMGSAIMHGFGGLLEAVLYKDVRLSIVPGRSTPNMFSWLPVFFPLKTPINVEAGICLGLDIWRCLDSSKRRVWYEWCVTSPTMSPIHYSKYRFTTYNGDGVDLNEGGILI